MFHLTWFRNVVVSSGEVDGQGVASQIDPCQSARFILARMKEDIDKGGLVGINTGVRGWDTCARGGGDWIYLRADGEVLFVKAVLFCDERRYLFKDRKIRGGAGHMDTLTCFLSRAVLENIFDIM